MRFSTILTLLASTITAVAVAVAVAAAPHLTERKTYTCADNYISKGGHMCKMMKKTFCEDLDCPAGFSPMYYKSKTDHGGWLCCEA